MCQTRKATDISSNWFCPPCIQTVLPFNHLDEDDDFCSAVFEESLNCSFRFHEINNRIFSPFEINQDLDTPFSEIDPDLPFYTETNHIQNMKCDYHIEDSFNDLFSCKKEENACASFFHLNIKSLPKHYDDLCILLESLSLRFSFVAITEVWLSDHTNELYGMPNYTMESRYRKCKKGGGVALYVNDSIPYTVREDLEFFYTEMESLFIEIESKVFQTPSNIIIGIVYRMPDSSIDIFNDRVADILNVINKENKLFSMLGDLNIDFLKCDEHRLTPLFIDILYSNNVFPLITKPTRGTQNTATLIDHILTNNFDTMGNHKQGILCTDISDHYAVAHVAGNTKNQVKDTIVVGVKRDLCQINVQKFIHEMQQIDWENVMNLKEAQAAFSEFQAVVTKLYNKPYFDRKPWLTSAL